MTAVVLSALIIVGPVQAQRSPSSSPAAATPIDDLLERLGHPGFRVREQASLALCEAKADALPRLVAAYLAEDRHEVKLRLRHVIEYVYYRQLMQGRLGFMGVAPVVAPNIFDPQGGKGEEAIVLQRVLSGFPAEKAGLKTGDVIVEYEGRPIREVLTTRQKPGGEARQALAANQRPSDPRLIAFTADVAQREPGSTVRLRLLRCRDEVRTVRLTVAADRAKTLEGVNIAPTIVTSAREGDDVGDEERLTTRPGLCVAGLAAGTQAAETGFEVGDVIVGFGGEDLRGGNSPAQLFEAVKVSPPGAVLSLDVVRLQSILVSLTLGGRPVDLMNLDDLEVARMKFAAWWREQSGEQSIRSPSAFAWLMPAPRTRDPLPGPVILP